MFLHPCGYFVFLRCAEHPRVPPFHAVAPPPCPDDLLSGGLRHVSRVGGFDEARRICLSMTSAEKVTTNKAECNRGNIMLLRHSSPGVWSIPHNESLHSSRPRKVEIGYEVIHRRETNTLLNISTEVAPDLLRATLCSLHCLHNDSAERFRCLTRCRYANYFSNRHSSHLHKRGSLVG